MLLITLLPLRMMGGEPPLLLSMDTGATKAKNGLWAPHYTNTRSVALSPNCHWCESGQ